MRLTHLLLATTLLLPPPTSGQPPREEPVPPRVSRYAEQVWADLIDTLDVDALLRPSCKEVVAHARRYPGDFPNLDRDLQLTDTEACNFVIDATTFAFQGLVRFAAVHAMKDVELLTEWELDAAAHASVEAFFPGRHLHVAGDIITDETGHPVFEELETREDVARFHDLMKTFRSLKAQGVQWKTPLLEEFERWFAAQQPDSTVIRRMPGTPGEVYVQCRYAWCLLIDHSGRQPKVTALVPFSQ